MIGVAWKSGMKRKPLWLLGWLLYKNGVEPHVTVFDKSAHTSGLSRHLALLATPIARQSTQATFGDNTQSKPNQHIRGPVRQQDNPCGNQANSDQPYHIALPSRQTRRGRRQRADMHRMA